MCRATVLLWLNYRNCAECCVAMNILNKLWRLLYWYDYTMLTIQGCGTTMKILQELCRDAVLLWIYYTYCAGLLFCHKYISWTVHCAGLLYYPLYRWCIRSKTPYSVSNRIVYRNRDTVKKFFLMQIFFKQIRPTFSQEGLKVKFFFTNPSKLEHLFQIQFCLCSGLVWLAVGFNLLNLFVTGRNLNKISWADSFKKWKVGT